MKSVRWYPWATIVLSLALILVLIVAGRLKKESVPSAPPVESTQSDPPGIRYIHRMAVSNGIMTLWISFSNTGQDLSISNGRFKVSLRQPGQASELPLGAMELSGTNEIIIPRSHSSNAPIALRITMSGDTGIREKAFNLCMDPAADFKFWLSTDSCTINKTNNQSLHLFYTPSQRRWMGDILFH